MPDDQEMVGGQDMAGEDQAAEVAWEETIYLEPPDEGHGQARPVVPSTGSSYVPSRRC